MVTFVKDYTPPKKHGFLALRETKVPVQGRGWSWRLSQKLTYRHSHTGQVHRNEGHCLPGLPESKTKSDKFLPENTEYHWPA